MGLIGGLRGATKGLMGGPARFEAVSSHDLEYSRAQVFSAGTTIETIPRQGRNLTLDFGRAAMSDVLCRGQQISARLDLSSLGKQLSNVLAARIGKCDIVVPMMIEQLDMDKVQLCGRIDKLGACSLEIALREAELTHASVSLGVDVEPLDIRTVAETQRDSLERLLAESIDEFSTEYIGNIRSYLGSEIVK